MLYKDMQPSEIDAASDGGGIGARVRRYAVAVQKAYAAKSFVSYPFLLFDKQTTFPGPPAYLIGKPSRSYRR
ncbi:MAG: hypothetical protein Kow0040_18470 [Thermogutta sp.]